MNKKVQLNDMELNQVAGGGWTEFWQKVKNFFTEPAHPILPIEPFPGKPVRPIIDR